MTTHIEGQDALTYVLNNVFKIGVDYPLALALEEGGYHDIHDIIGRDHLDIKALTYKDDQGNEIDLPMLHWLPITFLQCWSNVDDWKSITTQGFIDFCRNTQF
jgi:hypothetical protein